MMIGVSSIGIPQMTYLLDTSVFISFHHNNSEEVSGYIQRIQTRQVTGAISVVTYYEIWRGARDSESLATKALLRPFQIHSFSRQIANRAAEIYKALPSSVDKEQRKRINLDLIIAATADYYHCDLVTLDKDYSLFQLQNTQIIKLKNDQAKQTSLDL